MLGFLRRHSLKSFDMQTRWLLCLSFVRVLVGHASEVWSPQAINDITKVESLQRSATKFILHVNWDDDIPYHDPLVKSNLLLLSYWHEYKDLLFYYKCSTGSLNVNMHKFVNFKNTSLNRHSSTLDTLALKCHTKLFQASFFNRLPKITCLFSLAQLFLLVSLNPSCTSTTLLSSLIPMILIIKHLEICVH